MYMFWIDILRHWVGHCNGCTQFVTQTLHTYKKQIYAYNMVSIFLLIFYNLFILLIPVVINFSIS